jgi:hypothetical protein
MRKTFCFISTVLVFTTGCYSTQTIKPTELPKLNRSPSEAALQKANCATADNVIEHVEGIDGRMVEVEGDFDATVVSKSGTETEYEHPVISKIDDDVLEIRSSNNRPTEVPISTVKYIEVTSYDSTATTWTIVGISAGVVAIIGTLLIVNAIIASNSSNDVIYLEQESLATYPVVGTEP